MQLVLSNLGGSNDTYEKIPRTLSQVRERLQKTENVAKVQKLWIIRLLNGESQKCGRKLQIKSKWGMKNVQKFTKCACLLFVNNV